MGAFYWQWMERFIKLTPFAWWLWIYYPIKYDLGAWKQRKGCDYWESSEDEGEDEREVLTLSKLANRSVSRMLWREGDEGAKGSAKGSLAGREEEEKSPGGCGRKCPRRWKDSEDSVLESDDLLPQKGRTDSASNKKGRKSMQNKQFRKDSLSILKWPIKPRQSDIYLSLVKMNTVVLTWRWRRWSSWRTRFRGQGWGHVGAGRLVFFLKQVLTIDAKLICTIWLKQKIKILLQTQTTGGS